MAHSPQVPAQTSLSQVAFSAHAKDLADATAPAATGLLQGVYLRGPGTAGTPVQQTVPSGSSVPLLAANGNRLALVITNESAVKMFVRFGGAASSALYTHALAPGRELALGPGVYTGAIEARLESGSDSTAMCQEFTH